MFLWNNINKKCIRGPRTELWGSPQEKYAGAGGWINIQRKRLCFCNPVTIYPVPKLKWSISAESALFCSATRLPENGYDFAVNINGRQRILFFFPFFSPLVIIRAFYRDRARAKTSIYRQKSKQGSLDSVWALSPFDPQPGQNVKFKQKSFTMLLIVLTPRPPGRLEILSRANVQTVRLKWQYRIMKRGILQSLFAMTACYLPNFSWQRPNKALATQTEARFSPRWHHWRARFNIIINLLRVKNFD